MKYFKYTFNYLCHKKQHFFLKKRKKNVIILKLKMYIVYN